jgi:hypothetical protein
MSEFDGEINVSIDISEHSFLSVLDRIATALEKSVKHMIGLDTLLTEALFPEKEEVAETPMANASNVPTPAVEIPERLLADKSAYSEEQRVKIKAALDEIGAEYKPKTSTINLHKLLIAATASAPVAPAESDASDTLIPEAVLTEKAVPAVAPAPELEKTRKIIHAMLCEYTAKEGANAARALVKAYGKDAKISTLDAEQLAEISAKLDALKPKGDNIDLDI